MGDLLDDALWADLGSRRPPRAWASIAGPIVERDVVKTRRRENLANGSGFPQEQGSPSSNKKKDGELPVHLVLRRRDEHNHLPPSQRSSRASRAEAIARMLDMKMEPMDNSVTWLDKEQEAGAIEYKYKLNNPHPVRLQQLITQMKFRLSEGSGQCFYYLGVEDDGYPKGLGTAELEASIANLHKMASSLNAVASVVRLFPGAHGRTCALMRVQRALLQEVGYLDLRIAVAGCVDAGKSTLVSVLTHGSGGAPTLDSGRGSARVAVLKHKHEIETGRTSSLSHQFLGYDDQGRVLNYSGAEVCSSASRLLTFIDMGGHRKCLKTALYGLTALLPNYALLCCCGVRGLGRVSYEHLAVAVALQIPVAVVITKADSVTGAGLASVVQDVRSLISLAWNTISNTDAAGSSNKATSYDEQRVSPVIDDVAAAEQAAQQLGLMHMHTQETVQGAVLGSAEPGVHQGAGGAHKAAAHHPFVVPIFPVSCVTGQGIDVLHAFLRSLQPSQRLKRGVVPPAKSVVSAPDLSALCRDTATASNGHAAVGDVPVADNKGAVSTAATDSAPASTAVPGSAAGQVPSLTEWIDPGGAGGQKVQAGAGGGGEVTAGGGESGRLLSLHEATPDNSPASQEIHFQVDQMFEVPGVGSVVSGMTLVGDIQLGQRMLLGPNAEGHFSQVEITGIQRAHIPVHVVRAGQCATLAMQPVVEGATLRTSAEELVQQAMRLSSSGSRGASASGAAAAGGDLDAAACEGVDSNSAGVGQDGGRGGMSKVHELRPRSTAFQWAGHTQIAGAGTPEDSSSEGGPQSRAANSPRAGAAQPQRSLSRLGPRVADDSTWGSCSDGLDVQDTPVRADSPDATVLPAPGGASTAVMTAGGSADMTGGAVLAAGPIQAAAPPAVRQPPAAVTCSGPADVSPDLLQLFDMCDDEEGEEGGQEDDGPGGGVFDLFGGGDHDIPCTPRGAKQHHNNRNKALNKPAYSMPAPSRSVPDLNHGPDSPVGQACSPGVMPQHPCRPLGIRQRPLGQQARSFPFDQEAYLYQQQQQQQKLAELCGHPPASCMLATSPSSAVHRGAVLLGAGQKPHTTWSFEAVLVLLAGHWPPRGLISGAWPPVQDTGVDAAAAGSGSGDDAGHNTAGGLTSAVTQEAPTRPGRKLCAGDSGSGRSRSVCMTGDSRSSGSDVDSLSTGRVRHRAFGSPGWVWPSSSHGDSSVAGYTPGSTSGPGSPIARGAHVMPRDLVAAASPTQHEDGVGGGGGAEGVAGPQEGQGRRRHRRRKTRDVQASRYTCVIHCANIRQLACLVSMQELTSPSTPPTTATTAHANPEVHVMPSMRAAAALLHAPWQPLSPRGTSPSPGRETEEEGGSRSGEAAGVQEAGTHPDLGCIVKAVFRFDRRPEWLVAGSRLVVRDRTTGHVSAAGYVSSLVPPDTPGPS